MIYILYNPKAHSGNDDLNIVYKGDTHNKPSIKKINIIDVDVADFASKLTESDRVLIRGGDGTLNNFVNRAKGIEFPCKVYMIRSGTGNDFLNDIGQKVSDEPKDIRKYLKKLPVVKFNGKSRLFINGVGLGVDGEVCRGVEEYKAKNPNKKANYTAIALQELGFRYKRPSAKITVDGVSRVYDRVWAVSTMKGRYFGGGLKVAPSQDRESGKVSVIVMRGGTRPKALAVFAKLKDGGHVKHTDMVDVLTGYNVKVEFTLPYALQIDGEVFTGVSKYTVECEK